MSPTSAFRKCYRTGRSRSPSMSGMPSLSAIRCTAFSRMCQQVDGGRRDLFVWVGKTSGEGSQNRADPTSGTNQGAVAMGFYNVAAGDAPYFRELADNYALSDNHHQPVMGGTGANFQALATGLPSPIGKRADRRSRRRTRSKTRARAPAPTIGTRSPAIRAARIQCSDESELGIAALHRYLATLWHPSFNGGNCEPSANYLVNNYTAGFLPLANRRYWDRRCFAFRPKRSRRSPAHQRVGSPGLLEGIALRAILAPADRQGAGLSGVVGKDRRPRHDRRERRLLAQGLYSNPRRIRGRPAHPADRGLALGRERRCRPQLYRPHCDPQIYHGELASRPAIARSRDHLPNPVADPSDPYVPADRPAIGDLTSLFQF
jgi:Phosphoesterase family